MSSFAVFFAVYLAAGTAVALFVRRSRQSHEEYFVGSRAFGGALSAGTYAATTYSAFMMVGLVGLSFQHGVGALVFETAYLVATILLLSFYGPKIWRMGRDGNLVSPMEIFTERYGGLAAAVGTVIGIGALIPYTAVQVIGSALILQLYGGFHFTTAALLASVTIALWALLGGLRGVALTDALQGVFMLGCAVAGAVWARGRFGGFELQRFPNAFWTPAVFANLTIPWLFFALTNPQVLQRLYVLRDRTSLKRMIVFFGIFGLLYTLLVTFIGFAARRGAGAGAFPLVQDRDKTIIEILSRMGKGLSLPLALSIVFASVTTANSIILTLSSMALRDVFGERTRVWGGKLFIVLLAAAVFLFSVTRPAYVVELAVSSSSILLCFVPLLFGLFHWKRGGKAAGLATLLAGAAAALILRAFKVPVSAGYTLLASFAVFFAAGFLEKTRHRVRA